MLRTLMVIGFVFLAVSAFTWLWYRQACNKRNRWPRELVVSPMAGLSVGSMLLGFQAIVEPRVRHAIVEIQEEDSLDGADNEEPLGGRAFHEGLRRIRAGDNVGDLRVRIEPMWRAK